MATPTSLSAIRADALARRDRGDLDGARIILEQAHGAATMMAGEDHPEVLVTSHLLATLHRQAGDLAAARRFLESSLHAGGHRLGEDHPLLLAISFDLAEIADELGNRHEARRHYSRVARYGPQAAGFHQQQVLAAQAWLQGHAPQTTLPQRPIAQRPAPQPPATQALVPLPQTEKPYAPQAKQVGRWGIILIVTAIAIIAAAIIMLLLRNSPPEEQKPPAVTKVSNLTISSDQGYSIALTWTDPSNGYATQVVLFNKVGGGTMSKPVANGAQSITFDALNPGFNYCFQVVSAYSATQVARSEEVCTTR